MWLGVITLFPDMFDSVCREGVFSRAIESGVVSMRFFNPRDYTSDRHRTGEDRPHGGGAGRGAGRRRVALVDLGGACAKRCGRMNLNGILL